RAPDDGSGLTHNPAPQTDGSGQNQWMPSDVASTDSLSNGHRRTKADDLKATLNLRVEGSIPSRLTTLSSALSDGAKYLKSGAVTAVRLNRLPSYAIPSGKNSCCSRC